MVSSADVGVRYPGARQHISAQLEAAPGRGSEHLRPSGMQVRISDGPCKVPAIWRKRDVLMISCH